MLKEIIKEVAPWRFVLFFFVLFILLLAVSAKATLSDLNKPLWVTVDPSNCQPIAGLTKSTDIINALVKADEDASVPSGDYGVIINGSTNCDGIITFTKTAEGTVVTPVLTDADCAPQIANPDGSACVDAPVEVCPEGEEGTPPNCTPIVIPPVEVCATGYEGVFPDCIIVCDDGESPNGTNDGCIVDPVDPEEPPHMAGMPVVDTSLEPEGFAGYSVLRIQPEVYSPDNKTGTNEGDFRLNCNGFSHMKQEDPILNPGTWSQHHHTFFGNTSTNKDSDLLTLNTVGNSTCNGGIANRSAYWVMSMIDTSTGAPLPLEASVYYKTQRSSDVVAPPLGLQIIGKASNAGDIEFMCNEDYANRGVNEIPFCAQGGVLRYGVNLPNCWDGINLHLDDEEHMRHASWGAECPASHPVMIPNITINIFYDVTTEGGTANWRLASDMDGQPAGSSAHADWANGWDPVEMNKFIVNCLQAEKDCHADLLGDGTMYH